METRGPHGLDGFMLVTGGLLRNTPGLVQHQCVGNAIGALIRRSDRTFSACLWVQARHWYTVRH